MRLAALLLALAAPAHADRFVLVPGAWQGPDAWDAVAERLEAAGHEVAAVEMTGQGARAAEGGPAVTVEDNVEDVLAALDASPEPSILVAFSWGGRPASGAWDRARDKVAAAVWVEAPFPFDPAGLPADGQSLSFIVTFQPDDASRGMLPPPAVRGGPRGPMFPMSLKSLYDPVPVTGGPFPPGTFVYAADSALPGLRALGEALRDRDGWTLREVPGGHDVPGGEPDALAAILLDVADGA